MKKAVLLVALMVTLCGMTMACGRGRGRGGRRGYVSPPRDTTKPVVTCPPDKVVYADPFQVNTKVYWDEGTVVANDDRDGNIPWTRSGWRPGTILSEGTTKITYSARDKSGNSGSCTLSITVIVKTCNKWGMILDGWKICHVSHDSYHVRRGSVCNFGCYGGHELVGPGRSTCLDTESWDIPAQPFCQKLQCPALIPSQEQFDLVDISCTNTNYYRSLCSYNCVPGYSILPGNSKVQICNEYGFWLGTVPQCVDTEPPTYLTCPYGVTAYAVRTQTSGPAWWNTPQAQDNSGEVTIIQLLGPTPGTILDVGEYLVEYMAYDAANNTAICAFNVVVKQIKCHWVYPLPYTSVICPTGRIFGSMCEFLCDNGTVINGQRYAECTKRGSTVQYGVWSFENHQPYCEQQDTCPELQAPDNGALVCDTWFSGRFCQTQCQEKHVVIDDPLTELVDEAVIHKTLRVCTDLGRWLGSDIIPACQKVTDRQWMIIGIHLVYYTGVCSENLDRIKLNFITAIQNSLRELCQPDSCNVDNVKVICGDITKRDTSIYKREVSDGLSVEYTAELPSDIDGTDALEAQTNLTNSINAANENGDLDIDVDGEQISPIVEVSLPQGVCSDGSVFDQQSMLCVECTAGYYYDATYDACLLCPVGYYQDEDRHTSCKVCPTGTTTATRGASSLQHCKDACEAGYFSSTGIEPCTVCDLGTYSTSFGSTACTSCPGSQITLMSASTSLTECQEFDITYTVLSDTETSVPAVLPAQDMTIGDNITLELWVKCSQCDNILDITDEDGTQIVHIEDTDQVRLTWLGTMYDTGKSLVGSDTWKRITVTTFDGVVNTYIDSTVVLSEDYMYQSTLSTVNITVGGDGFVGIITQVNIWSTSVESPPLSVDRCNATDPGDVVDWKQFSELDGTYTLTKSKCDAVDNCLDSPCQNGGSCSDAIDWFSCACAEGFTGSVCDVNINDCVQSVCDNGGTCVDGVGNYTCQCPDGFTGELCEMKYVNGGWTEWVTSGGCSVTCGSGVQNRSRVCEEPEPSNGGNECEGDDSEIVECDTNLACVLGCWTDPPDIVNGSINCAWTDDTNDTRECHPSCDDGFDFDNDLFVYKTGIMCGPHTGHSWNINTTDNPLLQLPSCTPKSKALTNTLNYTMEYTTLNTLTPETSEQIHQVVDGLLNQTGCVGTGQCKLETLVYHSGSVASNSSGVFLTLQLSCDVTNDIDECYNLLADLVDTLETMITQLQFTVQYDGMHHDVGFNTSSLGGISTCKAGHVPVWHYCVACGKGTYAYRNYCEVCPIGTYQDLEAQTSCKPCPTDWTTAGYMTRDRSVCNVYVPYSDEEITNALVVGLAVGLSLAALVVITVVACRIMHKELSKSSEDSTSMPASHSGGMGNANTRFSPFKHALKTQASNGTIELQDFPPDYPAKPRSFSPSPCYNNYVGPDNDINEQTRPFTAFSLDPVTPTFHKTGAL